MQVIRKKFDLSPFDLILTTIIVAGNFIVSLYIAPALMLFIPQVFVGAFLMVPLNLFLACLVWGITQKRIFSLYFFTYGLLTMPTTIWGNTPGIFKPFLGIAIGLSLDLLALKLRFQNRMAKYLMAVVFPLIWWFWTSIIWILAGLPIVQLFQSMLIVIPILRPIVSQGFIATFTILAFMTMPSSLVAIYASVSLLNRVKKVIITPHDI